MTQIPQEPAVSFVIPAWNEEKLLGPTLDALHPAAASLGTSYEIVVADDASDDATPDVARARGARVVRCGGRHIAAARNAGARAASGTVRSARPTSYSAIPGRSSSRTSARTSSRA